MVKGAAGLTMSVWINQTVFQSIQSITYSIDSAGLIISVWLKGERRGGGGGGYRFDDVGVVKLKGATGLTMCVRVCV